MTKQSEHFKNKTVDRNVPRPVEDAHPTSLPSPTGIEWSSKTRLAPRHAAVASLCLSQNRRTAWDKTYDRLKEFTDAPALSVVVKVCDRTWLPSVEKAARFLAQWKVCLGSELWAGFQDTEIAAALEQLGGGGRILVVVAASETIPAALESLADMTLDLTSIGSNGKS